MRGLGRKQAKVTEVGMGEAYWFFRGNQKEQAKEAGGEQVWGGYREILRFWAWKKKEPESGVCGGGESNWRVFFGLEGKLEVRGRRASWEGSENLFYPHFLSSGMISTYCFLYIYTSYFELFTPVFLLFVGSSWCLKVIGALFHSGMF